MSQILFHLTLSNFSNRVLLSSSGDNKNSGNSLLILCDLWDTPDQQLEEIQYKTWDTGLLLGYLCLLGGNIIHCVGYLQLKFLYQYVPPYKHTDVLHVYVCVQYNVAYIILFNI